MNVPKQNIIVIGAGLGGLSAAISLATLGHRVEIHEKNEKVGGKLNLLQRQGYSFDMGPSIFTLPHYFKRLWDNAGKKMEDYVQLQAVTPHWRNFFEDGKVIDLHMDPEKMKAEVRKVGGEQLVKQVFDFLAYAEKQYDLIAKGYFEKGLDTVGDFNAGYSPLELLRMDYWHSMHGGVAKRIKNRYFVDIFDYFIKYVGSSAFRSPGFMNLMPIIQFRYDLWYVRGGMYNLARGLERLAKDLGVTVHLRSEVKAMQQSGRKVLGVVLADNTVRQADIVVSNMEVIPAYRDLLQEPRAFLKKLDKFEPACSGLVLHLGTDQPYPQLAHHNFVYSGDQKKHFRTVFQKKQLPPDPTLYVVAPSRTDPAVCPAGGDNIKILPHIPYLHAEHPTTDADYQALRDRVLDKMERIGLKDLRKHIVVEDMWTPYDIQKNYYSNGGSVYGVVSDRWKNFALKAPKRSSKYANLYFTGGSVNPGGGMPMVILCGQNVARAVQADLERSRPS